jgi:hypothetical protein
MSETKKLISDCAMSYSMDIDNLSQCITQESISHNSLELLGCAVQCSISSWKNATLYLHCLEGCLNESKIVTPNEPVIALDIPNPSNGCN